MPLALIGWLDHIHGAVPDWEEVGKILVMGADIVNTTSIKSLTEVSDTIVFDFLVDGLYLTLYIGKSKRNSHTWFLLQIMISIILKIGSSGKLEMTNIYYFGIVGWLGYTDQKGNLIVSIYFVVQRSGVQQSQSTMIAIVAEYVNLHITLNFAQQPNVSITIKKAGLMIKRFKP